MSVKDIEAAITQLAPTDLAELSKWFEEFQAEVWDRQIEEDGGAGRFASLNELAKAGFCGTSAHDSVKDPVRG